VIPKEIGVFDAKTQLSEILEDFERGQIVYLTKRGRRVAELRPVTPAKVPLVRGSAKSASYRMAPDFDAPLPDLGDYE
jgi:antitoxin (DNA-binding transcriptional repressor) of toxin-antitoxin stability system